MTRDIDLGVEVADWEQFNQLKGSLLATGKFSSARERHRLKFDSVPVDIVPFDAITDDRGRISWPPEHEVFMSLLGFREAFEYSITVRLSSAPELDIRLPTLSGLALMKLISWKEGYPGRQRDAEDLLLIMRKYEEAGNLDRLYDREKSLLEEESIEKLVHEAHGIRAWIAIFWISGSSAGIRLPRKARQIKGGLLTAPA
jgi:predicted nucleotidyltransferase